VTFGGGIGYAPANASVARVSMSNHLDYLSLMEASIRQKLKCHITHWKTVPVHERLAEKTIWQGNIEVFELEGHAEAKKCYAWFYYEQGKSVRYVVVLESRLVKSPEEAVKSAIFFDVQPLMNPGTNPLPQA
jgi:hypothetical protein